MSYADVITITSTLKGTSAANTYLQAYLHNVFAWSKHNSVTGKRTCYLFTPEPAEYKSNLELKINNTTLPMATHPKILGLALD